MEADAMLGATESVVDGEQSSPRSRPVVAVHIHFYGPAEPIVLALPRAQPQTAHSYYERVKSEVIEAQRHNNPQVVIRPFDRRRGALKLDPKTIQRVDLVDGLEPSPTLAVLTPPVPRSHQPGAHASTAAEAESPDPVRTHTEAASARDGRRSKHEAAKRPDAGEELPAELQRRIAILLG